MVVGDVDGQEDVASIQSEERSLFILFYLFLYLFCVGGIGVTKTRRICGYIFGQQSRGDIGVFGNGYVA